MFAESVLFAFLLVVLGQLQGLAFRQWGPVQAAVPAEVSRGISFLGAGIYEEVLFRLCLIPACYAVWRILLLPHRPAACMAVVASSLLFAAAHYVGPTGEAFAPFTFTFRAFAGVFFAVLFVLRGFGVAAGTHAAYDLLVGVILVH
jgi:membrane protease YdiL (CAAX protease family)